VNLLIFGCGYVAQYLLPHAHATGWTTVGTHRKALGHAADNASAMQQGLLHRTVVFDGVHPIAADVLAEAEAILVSVPPATTGTAEDRDPVLQAHHDLLQQASNLRWLGYISSTSVYGDRGGDWVDETSPIAPQSPPGIARARAEAEWQTFAQERNLPLFVFRSAGIYGPGRNMLERLAAGHSAPAHKPGCFVSRIHVDDFVAALLAALCAPSAAGVYNLADDEPTPTADVASFAAQLLGLSAVDGSRPTSLIALHTLTPHTSLGENRRVRNSALKALLGHDLRYPSYREGFSSLLKNLKQSS